MVGVTYHDLTDNQELAGFRAKAVYKNGMGQAMGARFLHQKSGFQLDLIEIQTVPQSFLTVHTFPVSNMGEPHTQEHLVLGKGNVGRAVAARETMSMIESTAFTQQLKTCYPFAANAGIEAYFDHFERSCHALLNPDYTDEEIRREVRNFGVQDNKLEEKGSIYTEMISASAQPGYKVYRAMGRLLFGDAHPVSYDSGGDPAAMRLMQADDIRRFHAANYHLANMELITCLPKGISVDEALGRYDRILSALQGDRPVRPGSKWTDLPAPKPDPSVVQRVVEFPSLNLDQPGPAMLAWPVMPRLNPREEGLADLFAQAFGGDPSTNLYKLFIDSKTRQTDIGARSVAMGFDNEPWASFYIYIPDLAAAQATPERLAEIGAMVNAELERVASWADGSPELSEFHDRMQANLVRMRRSADKLTSSPPGFGGRMSQSIWPALLRDLNEEPGFEKELLQPALFAYLEGVIASPHNIWRDRIAAWRLHAPPQYSIAAKASAKLIETEEAALQQRLAAETARLKSHYGVTTDDEAVARYKQEYDAATAELDRVQSMDTPARFIDSPPMTLDDQLDYTVKSIAGGVTLVTGLFSGMNSATIGLALDARELQGRQLIYAALLPQLWTGSGVKDLTYEEAMQRMRREILGVSAAFSTNPTTGRFELAFNASGNTLDETKAALGWLHDMLHEPNWSLANLNRLRDVVDQSINALRGTMQRSEEHWVQGPAQGWTYQDDPLYLSVSSFHAQLHHLTRLRWLLAEADNIEQDLQLIAPDLPESSRESDLAFLGRIARQDLSTPVSDVLAELNQVRQTVLKRAHARLHLTASPENAAVIEPLLESLVEGLPDAPVGPHRPLRPRAVAQRVTQRENLAQEPAFVGLLAPNMQGGVHLHSVPGVSVADTDEESALNFLAFRLFSGAGPHGIFMKTWAAGLAYSNGLRASAFEGRLHYYAERCTELPQTMQFVVNELKASPRDKPLAEYAMAQIFAGTRAGGSFESRTSSMASDLADNWGPEVVRAFRSSILKLRGKPDLDRELYARVDALYASVLPGYDGLPAPQPGATYYVIGPEKQIAAWEKYLGTKVERLYGRDYWVVVE